MFYEYVKVMLRFHPIAGSGCQNKDRRRKKEKKQTLLVVATTFCLQRPRAAHTFRSLCLDLLVMRPIPTHGWLSLAVTNLTQPFAPLPYLLARVMYEDIS